MSYPDIINKRKHHHLSYPNIVNKRADALFALV